MNTGSTFKFFLQREGKQMSAGIVNDEITRITTNFWDLLEVSTEMAQEIAGSPVVEISLVVVCLASLLKRGNATIEAERGGTFALEVSVPFQYFKA